MLATHAEHDRVLDLGPVVELSTVLAAQSAAATVHASDALRRYVVDLAAATRDDPRVELGASPRAGLLLFRAAKARAALGGATTLCPTTFRRWPPQSFATGSCLRRDAGPKTARSRSATRSSGCPRSRAMMGTSRAVGILAAALIGAGLAFDLAALYEPGVGLLLLIAGARAWVRMGSRGVRLRRVRSRATVLEDEPLELRFALERGSLPPPGVELRDPRLDGSPPEASGPEHELTFTTSWPRRGRKKLGPTSVAVRDPLGLCEEVVEEQGSASVLVLPRLEPIRMASDGGGGGGLGALGLLAEGSTARRGATAVEVEVDGLRPYRRGSPASRIHWPTVARTREMVELRLHAGAGARPLVVLDSSARADEAALDRAVRAAASLCHHLAVGGGCGLVISGEVRMLEVDSRLRGWPEAHARLALARGGERPPLLRGGRARGAVVFWVTPGASGPPRGLGAAEAFVVAPLHGSPQGALFTVAGCGGSACPRALPRPPGDGASGVIEQLPAPAPGLPLPRRVRVSISGQTVAVACELPPSRRSPHSSPGAGCFSSPPRPPGGES